MKEDMTELRENHSPKSDSKEELTLYLIGTLLVAIIYGVVTSNYEILPNIERFIPSIIGATIIPAIIAGLVTWMNKGKYVKNLFWTSLVVMTLSAISLLSL